MFNSAILDTAIGVIVIFLQLSLVCTAVNEFVALLLQKRAKELEKGILTLLTNPELVDKFYAHPLIKGLRPDQRRPSYIPSRTFTLALMDIVRRNSFDGAVTAATQAVADREKERSSAQAAVDAAVAALQEAQAIRTAAATALAATAPANLVAATKAVEDAAKQEDAARTAKDNADAKLKAATAAKDKADQFLTQVTADAKAAKDAETAAKDAETAASEKPKDASLQKAAAIARQKANDAADKLAPSASSLMTEARDKLAGVQSNVVPLELKTALLALLDDAGSNLNKAQANIEQWFDDAMDRVSGVYKHKSQVFIGIIAVVVTLLANVDTLQVANSLSHDKAVRDSLVAAAPELARKDPTSTATQSDAAGGSGAGNRSGTGTSGAGTSGAGTSGAGTSGAGTSGAGTSGAGTSGAGTSGAGTSGAGTSGAGTSGAGTSGAGTSGAGTSGAGTSGAGTAKGNTGASGGNASASATPEPSINSIKASLDQLNKLGLPIGYVRVCTVLEESVVDSCVTETAAKEAKAKLTPAEKNEETAKAALTTAEESLRAAEKNPNDQAALGKAKADFDTAKATHDKAATELTNAQKVHGKAAAKVEEINKVKTELDNATKALGEKPTAEQLQTYREARARLAYTTRCPKCQKESELTADELKRRLPTTHDYQLFSGDFFRAIGALIGDSWNLLYTHWFGWLITAFAISLGAPFWFDTLNRIMVIRSTVKPHEKSKEQESKDNPDEDDKKKKT